MLRLSRALVIQDLERLVEDSIIGRTEWSAKGVDCRRERHGYSSPGYSFDLDILNLRARGGPGGAWELFIVTEFWRSAQGTTVHSPKWLKLIRGKPNDVLKWIAANRERGGQPKGARDESLTSTPADALSNRARLSFLHMGDLQSRALCDGGAIAEDAAREGSSASKDRSIAYSGIKGNEMCP